MMTDSTTSTTTSTNFDLYIRMTISNHRHINVIYFAGGRWSQRTKVTITVSITRAHTSEAQFNLLRHVTTHACRARRDKCVAPCLFQYGGRRRSSSACVNKLSLLCSGFASISGTTSGKSDVDMSTPVHALATTLNTRRASRACRARRDARVALCCPTSAHARAPKCMG